MERLGGLGRAHARGAADLLLAGQHRPAPQAAPRRAASPTPPASTSSATTAPGCSTSAPPATCAPGCAPTSPPPRPAPGWARWSASPPRSTGIECATPLEAEVRELRLIAEHKPRYNRRSRFPEKVHFIKLTREPWPRLSLVRRVLDDDADYLGPFSSKKTAEKCLAALHETFPVRQCSDRLGPRRRPGRRACWPRWGAACPRATAASTPRRTPPWCASCATPCSAVPTRSSRRSTPGWPRWPPTSGSRRPGIHRDRLAAFVRAAARTQRLSALTRCPEVVAARREDDGRWAVHVVRFGRLAAAGVIPPGADARVLRRHPARLGRDGRAPRPARCRPRPPRRPRRSCAGWSRRASVSSTSTASGPARSPAPPGTWPLHDAVNQSRLSLVPFDDRRDVSTVHQPVR